MKHQQNNTQPTLARRKLLKALAAAGGAVAAGTLIPEQWAKPVVEIGYLPVHAQTSAMPQLSAPSQTLTLVSCSASGQPGDQYIIDVTYTDTTDGIVPGARINHTALFQPSGATVPFTVILTNSSITGTPSAGTLSYPVCIHFAASDTSVVNTISATNISGQTGNTVTVTITKPTTSGPDKPASKSAISGG